MSKFYLSLLGVLALGATTAKAQTWKYEYNEENHTADIAGVTGAKGAIKLPETTEKDGKTYRVTGLKGGDGTGAFQGNTDITSVDLGSTLTAINDHAFKDCINLESVTGGSSVNWIGGWAFEHSGLKYFTWPEQMSYIADGVFFNCPNLITVALPQGLKTINAYAFQHCQSLQYLTLPASVTLSNDKPLDDTPSMRELIYLGTTTPFGQGWVDQSKCKCYITAANTKEGWTDVNVTYDYPITLSANDGTYAFDHFGRDFAVDFSDTEGLSAYVAYNLSDGHLLMKKVQQVPAGAGAWLIGEQGKTYTVKILASVDDPAYDILTANLDRSVSGDESRSNIVWESPKVTSDDYKYSTLVSQYPLDFTNSGLKAYLAKYNNGTVTYTDVTKVPANTPVLVYGETTGQEYTIDFLKQSDTADDVTANGLQGSATEKTTCDGTQYGLGVVDSKLGWYKMTEGTLDAGKAYLSISSSSAKSFYEIPATIVTGINTVNADKKADDVYYDLMGRRVYAPQHGVYIHNGKKVVVK